jgi:hypothetical protein
MNIQNDDIEAASSQYYVWHPITNELYPFNCLYDSFMYENSCTQFMILISLSIEKMDICLLVQCHLCPIWPVFPLNVTCMLRFLPPLPWANLLYMYSTSTIPSTKPHVHFLSLRSFVQGICPGPKLLVHFRNKVIFYGEELLAPRPTPKLEDHPFVGCPWLLIQYIRSYPPYLEGISSIHNLRMRHAVVTRDPPNMVHPYYWIL